MITPGKLAELPPGKWVKKKKQELEPGPNLIAKKVDNDVVECDVIFWPRLKFSTNLHI